MLTTAFLYGIFFNMKKNISKIHCDIDSKLKKDFKVIAAKQGKKIREIITYIVSEYVKVNK